MHISPVLVVGAKEPRVVGSTTALIQAVADRVGNCRDSNIDSSVDDRGLRVAAAASWDCICTLCHLACGILGPW